MSYAVDFSKSLLSDWIKLKSSNLSSSNIWIQHGIPILTWKYIYCSFIINFFVLPSDSYKSIHLQKLKKTQSLKSTGFRGLDLATDKGRSTSQGHVYRITLKGQGYVCVLIEQNCFPFITKGKLFLRFLCSGLL